ncbi:YhbP family protein [Morganella morganii]|uniref:YhbP family protein n=1 Tax=Morganella morganii TaxID=582 RepID=UPI003EC08DEB
MELPHDSILSYLKKNHVVTLCATAGDDLWCASCFYVADTGAMMLYFLTEPHTRHGTLMQQNPLVAGTISAQTVTVAKIRGIQFRGEITTLSAEEEKQARAVYCRRFPVAIAAKTPLRGLRLDEIKMVNNTLGFGKKLHWSRFSAGVSADSE